MSETANNANGNVDIGRKIQSFLGDCTIIDLATTSLDTEKAEICEVATGHWQPSKAEWKYQSMRFKTIHAIPANASEQNGLTDAIVEGEPYMASEFGKVSKLLGSPKYFVSHGAGYDSKVLRENVIRYPMSADYDKVASLIENSGETGTNGTGENGDKPGNWICTLGLAKSVYGPDAVLNGEKPCFRLANLRYSLDLNDDGLDPNASAGGAGGTVEITSFLLTKLVAEAIGRNLIDVTDENADIGAQIHALSWIDHPYPNSGNKGNGNYGNGNYGGKSYPKGNGGGGAKRGFDPSQGWPYGKHKGTPLDKLPNRYLAWAVENLDSLKEGSPKYNKALADAVYAEVEKRVD